MMKKILLSAALLPMAAVAQIQTSAGVQYLQCQAKDMSGEFSDFSNTYFLADSLQASTSTRVKDCSTGNATVSYRDRLSTSMAIGLCA